MTTSLPTSRPGSGRRDSRGHLLHRRHCQHTHRFAEQGQGSRIGCEGLKQTLGKRPEAPTAEKALRELLSAKGDVEYGVALVTAVKAESTRPDPFELTVQIIRLGR
jgi:hypothetical protein